MKARRRTFSDMSILESDVSLETQKTLLQNEPGLHLKQRVNNTLKNKIETIISNVQNAFSIIDFDTVVEVTIYLMRCVQPLKLSGLDKKSFVLEVVCYLIDTYQGSLHKKKLNQYYYEYLPLVRDVLPKMIDSIINIEKRKIKIKRKKGLCS